MISKRLLLLLLTASFFQNVSAANSGEEQFDILFSWLDSFSSLSGAFRQTQSRAYEGVSVESTGDFKALKPDYFSWHQITPDNQLVLSNAEFIWHYDKDLETVTRRKISDQMASLQLLLGDSTSIKNEYSILLPNTGDYHLTPRNPHSNFQMIRLYFTKHELSQIRIIDRIGHELIIELSDLQYNPSLTAEDFVINASENAEFLYDENF